MEFLQMSGKKQGKLHVLVHLELNRCLTVSCMLSVTDHIHLITMQLLISTDCRDVKHVFALFFCCFQTFFVFLVALAITVNMHCLNHIDTLNNHVK